MTGELMSSSLTWVVVGIAFIGSLFACRGIADRFWFTVGMPIVYALIFFLCFISIGAIVGNFLPKLGGESLQLLATILAGSLCFGIFVLQVCSMARDPRGVTRGYSIVRPRKRSMAAQSVKLQRLPTRKRWSG